MRPLLMRLLLPASVACSLAAFFFARHAGVSIELALFLASSAILAASMALERSMPLRADWNRPCGDRATDWTSFAVLVAAVQPLLKAASALAVVRLYGSSGAPHGPFGAGWPFAVQLLAVTLLAELGKYWGPAGTTAPRPCGGCTRCTTAASACTPSTTSGCIRWSSPSSMRSACCP